MHCPKSRANKIWKLLPAQLRPIWDLIKKRRRIPEDFVRNPLITFECLLKIRKYNYKVEYNPKVDKIINEKLNQMDSEFMESTIAKNGNLLERINYNYEKINKLVQEKGLNSEQGGNMIRTDLQSKGLNKEIKTHSEVKGASNEPQTLKQKIDAIKNIKPGEKKIKKQVKIEKDETKFEEKKDQNLKEQKEITDEIAGINKILNPLESTMRLRQEKAHKLENKAEELLRKAEEESKSWFTTQGEINKIKEDANKMKEEAQRMYALNRKDRDIAFPYQQRSQKLHQALYSKMDEYKKIEAPEYKVVTVTKSNIADIVAEQDKIIKELNDMDKKPKKKVVEVNIKKEMIVKKEFVCKYCNGDHHPDNCPKRKK
jgi:hypothetical protein